MKKIIFLLTLLISAFSFSLTIKPLTENEKKVIEIIEEKTLIEINKKLNEYKNEKFESTINFDNIYNWGIKYVILNNASIEIGANENISNIEVQPTLHFIINENNVKLLNKKNIERNFNKIFKKKTGKNFKNYKNFDSKSINYIQNIIIDEIKKEWKNQWNKNSSKEEMKSIRKSGKLYILEKNMENQIIEINLNDFQ